MLSSLWSSQLSEHNEKFNHPTVCQTLRPFSDSGWSRDHSWSGYAVCWLFLTAERGTALADWIGKALYGGSSWSWYEASHHVGHIHDWPLVSWDYQALRDYRKPNDWYIGEMLLDSAERNHGLGTMIYQSFASWAKQQGVKRLLLAVLEENRSALGFWTGLGYKIIKEFSSRKIGRREHRLIELEYRLAESNPTANRVLHFLNEDHKKKMRPRRGRNIFWVVRGEAIIVVVGGPQFANIIWSLNSSFLTE